MKKGFTLIELMIAIVLMSTGMMAIYALIPHGIKTSITNIDKYTATQLAREGIEIIRNIRDTNWIEQMSSQVAVWDEGLTGCVAGCEVDYITPTVQDPILSVYGSGRYFKIDSNGFYNYTVGSDTKFKRKITITPVAPAGEALQVIVIVNWSTEYADSVLEETLYDWK